MDFLPIFLDIKQSVCLVVGGGEIAARKIDLLLKAGGRIKVVSPDICNSIVQLFEEERIEYQAATYRSSDLDDCQLVIAATNQREVNRQVSEDAKARQIPVNAVDQPELCTFITPLDNRPLPGCCRHLYWWCISYLGPPDPNSPRGTDPGRLWAPG